jgi:hypothetical protein
MDEIQNINVVYYNKKYRRRILLFLPYNLCIIIN